MVSVCIYMDGRKERKRRNQTADHTHIYTHTKKIKNYGPAGKAREGEARLATKRGEGAVQPPGEGVAPAAGVVEYIGGAVVFWGGFVFCVLCGLDGMDIRVCVYMGIDTYTRINLNQIPTQKSISMHAHTYQIQHTKQNQTYMMSIPFFIASRMKPRRSNTCSLSSSRRNISAMPPTCLLTCLLFSGIRVWVVEA